jgi:predicted Rossmann fold nucleotide-binding protein DprA/Smf involved in DNA uptake
MKSGKGDEPRHLSLARDLGKIRKNMSLDLQSIGTESRDYPSYLQDREHRGLFPQVWALGDINILQKPLLGFFCSVKCPGEVILRTYDLARALRDAGVPVISGFHSPIEKDCLDLLLRGTQPVVLCPARGIQKMRLGKDLKTDIGKGKVLVLSPFEGKVKRPTAQISELRNLFVGALAEAVFVSYAEPGGKTEKFCKGILSAGELLYTFNNSCNKAIIDIGAKPVDARTLIQWSSCLKPMATDGDGKG